jgi:hypothetical protein
MSLDLYLNEGAEDVSKSLVASQTDNRTRGLRQQVSNDKIPVNIWASDGKGNIIDLQGGSVKLGIGDKNARASSGEWSLYDGTSIVTVSHNVSPTTLQLALRTVTFNGDANVSVDGCALSPYILTYSTVGTRPVPTINIGSLNPTCIGSTVDIITGDVSTVGKQRINIGAQPLVLVTPTTAIANGGLSGSMSLATEGMILALCGAGGSITKTLEVEFTDGDGNVRTLCQIPITISGEVIPDGATGTVNLSTFALESYVDSKYTSTQTYTRSLGILQDLNVNGKVNANGGITLRKTSVATSATITQGPIVEYTSTATTGTINLTVPSSTGELNELFIVTDEGGVAESNNITITFSGATIDGQNSIAITANKGSVQFIKSGATTFKTVGGNNHTNSYDKIPVTKDENGYIIEGVNQLRDRRISITITATLSTPNAVYAVNGSGRTLPINITDYPIAGDWLEVKDEAGNAGASNIIITATNALIDGATNATIATNYGSVKIYSNGTNFFTR